MKYTYPAELSGDASIVSIDAELVPIVTGALKRFLLPFVWETAADYRRGYNAIAGLLAQMPNNYLERLVRAQEYTARVLDTALNGAEYTIEGGEAVPPIPLAPPASTDEPNAMRAHLGRLWQLGENAATGAEWAAGAGVAGSPALPSSLSWAARLLGVQGTQDAGWFAPDVPVTLKMLLEAARINSEGDRTIVRNATNAATEAVNTGANAADAIGDYLQAAADAGTDGGVIAIQLATSAAILGVLQRINYALNGNPVSQLLAPAPLSFMLAGDGVPSSSNNVLSLLAAGSGGDVLSQILAALYDEEEERSVGVNLDTMRQQLAGLQTLTTSLLNAIGPIGDAPAGETVRELLQAQLECCESANAPVYPDPAAYACESYPTLALIGDAEFDTSGQMTALEWAPQGSAAGLVVTGRPDGIDTFQCGFDPRDLCVSLVLPVGVSSPAGGIGGAFNSVWEVDPTTPSDRPDPAFSGGTQDVTGAFWLTEAGSSVQVAYRLSLSASTSLPAGFVARIYVYAGGVG